MVTGTGTVAFAEGRRWQHQGGGNCQDERCLAKQRHATARAVARDVSIALGGELIEVDNRGQRLVGCLTCNLWAAEGKKRWVRLSVEDLHALHELRHKGSR